MKDLRFAFRRLRRAPLFSAAVVLILGLGIGANATTMSIVNAFMWRPVNVPDPGGLIAIGSRSTTTGLGRNLPLPIVDALPRAGLPLDSPCGYGSGSAAADANGQPARLVLMAVAGDCFATFWIQPLLGRLIGREDAPLTGQGAAVAVLGYSFWQRAFGGDPAAVGKTMRVDDTTVTVVGVLPRSFTGLNKDLDLDAVVPYNAIRRSTGAAYVIGRLHPGTSVAQLERQLGAAWSGLHDEALPADLTGEARRAALEVEPHVQPAAAGLSTLRNLYGSTFTNIAGLTALLVVLTGINVGGLLCSRLASALGELGVMRALGASRMRIVRTLSLEAMLLALGGCLIGLPLAYAAAPTFVGLLPQGNQPWTIALHPDGRVIAATAGTALAVVMLIAAVPAWLATRKRSLHLSASRTATRATNRSAQALLVVQIAATVVLVFGCSLLVRSLVALERVNRGYGADNVVSMRLIATAGGYTGVDQPSYYRELVERVAALPGVESVGMARYFGTVPDESGWYGPVSWSGDDADATTAIYEYASPGFFHTVGIPLLSGRDFSWSDAPSSAPVVLVSDSLARTLDPAGDVVGRFLRYGTDPGRQRLQIVGVVGNTSFGSSRATDIRTVYFPGTQVGQATYGTLHIRTDMGVAAVAEPVREILAATGREQTVAVSTIDGLFENWLVAERMGAAVSAAVTLLALCIACVGIYALLAYAVARRTPELGIRMAVGATARDVSWLVVRDAALVAGLGVAVGIPAALMASRLLESLVFGIPTGDVTMLAASAVLLIVIALGAAVIPARRAVGVDPAIALRAE